MAPPKGWTTSLLEGLAAWLAQQGVGAWHPDGEPYAADEVAITLYALPDLPDRAIALAAYPLTDSVVTNDTRIGVQARCRGAKQDPSGADDLADQVTDVVHGLTGMTFGGVRVIQALRQSSAQLGRDPASGRWERAESFHLDAARPTLLRP
jgi:minor capsid protein